MATFQEQPAQPAQPAQQNDWTLVWSDDFERSGLPDNRWWYQVESNNWVHDSKHNELQWYTHSRRENVSIEEGVLKIVARQEKDWIGAPFTSGRIRTTRGFRYGRFEIRAKLPAAKRGVWPAIWLAPTENVYGRWPKSGEIDIMENVGFAPGQIHATIHTEASNHRNGHQKSATLTVPDAHDAFHVYAIEWLPDAITWFVDGQAYFRIDKTSDVSSVWPFDQKFHIILNVAVGGNWGAAQGIDHDAFPLTFHIDYVRVFQQVDTPSEPAPKKVALVGQPPSSQPSAALDVPVPAPAETHASASAQTPSVAMTVVDEVGIPLPPPPPDTPSVSASASASDQPPPPPTTVIAVPAAAADTPSASASEQSPPQPPAPVAMDLVDEATVTPAEEDTRSAAADRPPVEPPGAERSEESEGPQGTSEPGCGEKRPSSDDRPPAA